MGNSLPHGSRWSKEFKFHTEAAAKPSKTTSSYQVPTTAELNKVKPQDLTTLANMGISWR